MSYPTVDESFGRLRRAGWSAGHARFGRMWAVYGVNGEYVLDSTGATLEEAYWRACEQARAAGMLAPARDGRRPRGREPQPQRPANASRPPAVFI
jgi:hypothetical protein